MTTEVVSSPSIADVDPPAKVTGVQESELPVSKYEENTKSETSVQDNQEEFYLNPSLIDKSIVKRIGIEKSTNLLIVEACTQIITQTINIADFSEKTIRPLKKQLSDLLVGHKNKEDKQNIINRTITCINNNISKISQYCKESSSLSTSRLITSSSSSVAAEEESNKADVLINLASSPDNTEKFFKDQNGRICAATRLGPDRHLEILGIDGTKYKLYLSKLYRQNRGSCISDSSINTVVTNLASEAEFNGDTIPLHLKVAWGSEENRAKKDCIYYDMCDTGGRIIEVSKDGWRIIDGSDKNVPIIFKRFNQKPQVEPDRNYPEYIFEKLVNLTNVRKKDNRQLLKVYIISTLIPEIDHAILTTYGPKGSAKSFLLELIKKLVDPTKPLLLTLHRNAGEFIQQVNHNYINYYDNVKFIPYWLSDEICKSVTGAGHTKRELYSDDNDIIYEHRRPLGLNGINVALTEADALDRSISIELEDIDEDKRKKEADLWAEFEKIKPQAFAYILDVIVKAMQIKEKLNLKNLPRMADFAEWSEAISQAMDYPPMSFMEIYKENRNEQNIIAVNENIASSLLLKYILDFEAENGLITEMQYEPQELHNEVKLYAENNEIDIRGRQFPKDAASFVKKIKTVIPNFKAGYGIIINVGRNSKDNTSIITISRKTATTSDKTAISEDDPNSSTGGMEPPEAIFTKSIKEDSIVFDSSDSNSIDNNTKNNSNSGDNPGIGGDNSGS